MYGMRGYGHHYRHHGWHGPRPFMGFFFFIPVLMMLFFGFVLLKFLWPLLLIGIGIALFSRSRRGDWGRGGFGPRRGDWGQDWHEKFKNEWDDKPKHDDDHRYTRTADGDWVEIV